MSKPKIEVYPDENEQYLIYLTNSGVIYETQANGFACDHPSAEGVLIPLKGFLSHEPKLYKYCCNIGADKWDLIDTEFVNSSFRHDFCYEIRVDRESEQETMEAWVPVVLKKVAPQFGYTPFSPLENFPDEFKAIFIWENCD